tara:strand:+ start:484 stop:747 length:264 start_codon:yes stop_codon:yes gene_type:complete
MIDVMKIRKLLERTGLKSKWIYKEVVEGVRKSKKEQEKGDVWAYMRGKLRGKELDGWIKVALNDRKEAMTIARKYGYKGLINKDYKY